VDLFDPLGDGVEDTMVKKCFLCDGTGLICDICGESEAACECEENGDEPTYSECEDCGGTGE
jgi:hypothetical protein